MRAPGGTEGITVITVTRGRPQLLRRCLETVRAQDFPGPVTHLIVVDDDEPRYRPLVEHTARSDTVRDRSTVWHFRPRLPGDVSGPPVLSRLRNAAVELADTGLISFLDDDNLLEPHHLSSLFRSMRRSGSPAVHSQCRLIQHDGTPYLDARHPWVRDVEAARARYLELRGPCVYVPWSNVLRDQVDAGGSADRVQNADTSEWLFDRELLRAIPFPETYDVDDWRNVVGEDNKLLRALVEAEVPMVSTHMPTLLYTLGGYSNAFRDDAVEGEW
ncbi:MULTISPECIES: glycosyltransferase family A protein [unclassified Streptomyces]|uniref:glycosyltransferase family A protein n=1 Tax=unclassified Streptomyces TaxID=2593676 RepID=UPI00073BE20B|nr:glycosyltransferase family A protein [Streptomyces sp. AVP053U2]ODA70168.1 Glycosyl transferase family 2 [Streptomyces sp. AVP053U2]